MDGVRVGIWVCGVAVGDDVYALFWERGGLSIDLCRRFIDAD